MLYTVRVERAQVKHYIIESDSWGAAEDYIWRNKQIDFDNDSDWENIYYETNEYDDKYDSGFERIDY